MTIRRILAPSTTPGSHAMKRLVPHYLKMIAWGSAIALQGQILFAEPIIYRVDIGSGPTNTALVE